MIHTLYLLVSLFVFFCFWGNAQNPFYYKLDGTRTQLKFEQNEFLVSTDSTFKISDLGNCQYSKIKGHYYRVSDTSQIENYSGINFITQAVSGEDNNLLFTSKELIFRFKDNVDRRVRDSILLSHGIYSPKINRLYCVSQISYSENEFNVSALLFETGFFEFCTPNFWVHVIPSEHIPNDTYFSQQWYLHNTGQGDNDGHPSEYDADIDAPEAWEITRGNPSVIIAVIDHGVSDNHPDLPNSSQVRLPGSNFAAPYDNSSPDNPSPKMVPFCANCYHNHGNACAGIIAATQDNNEGISGIAPNCKIMPIRIPLSEIVTLDVLGNALLFAADNGANVVSNSWNAMGPGQPALEFAIQTIIDENKIVVFTTGNTAVQDLGMEGTILGPADSEIPNLIIVGASDRRNVQANYSPTSSLVSVVAPSHSFYSTHTTHADDSYNVWTIDIPGEEFGTNSWRDDAYWPPLGEELPDYGLNYSSYTGRFGGTSAAAPQVAAVAALMLSVNPCLKVQDVSDILKLSSDKIGGYNYSYNVNKPGHSKEVGYGKINAYRAVSMALEKNTLTYDLFMKDNSEDIGLTGVFGTGGGGDNSPDIWIRNNPDGNTIHQNPEFSDNNPCYVYIRVRNKSCYASSGNDILNLYWSRAATSSSWPENWNGSDPNMGNLIGSVSIPIIPSGSSDIIMIPWTMINPHINNTWNSCLLARIESALDNQTFYSILADDITQNNNVSIKNVTIIDQVQGLGEMLNYEVLSGNSTNHEERYNLSFISNPTINESNIFREAEVTITFDSIGWEIFRNSGGFDVSGIRPVRNRTILITDSIVIFPSILFPPKCRIPLRVNLNFLAKRLTENKEYSFSLTQTDTSNKLLGTETFIVYKDIKADFIAYAGEDRSVTINDSVSLNADLIPDSAIYNWYDSNDSLVYTGSDFSSVIALSQNYKLEVIRMEDGLKDYDDITIYADKGHLGSISPIPTNSTLTVEYNIHNSNSTYLCFVNTSTGTTYNYILTELNDAKTINVSNWPIGTYSVHLVSQGEIIDSKIISIL